MSETTGNQQETKPAPWEEKYVLKPIQTVVETISNAVKGKMPWEQEYAPRAIPEPSRPIAKQLSFDDVFNRLIDAESRGVHASGGKLTASKAGALGVTQVMPKTGADPGYGIAPLKDNSKEEYIRFGRDYLRAMVREFDGDFEKALAAYNAGPGHVKKAIEKAKGGDWKPHLPKTSETLPYIEKILRGGNATKR
jgi:Transglycosylase SLT domain